MSQDHAFILNGSSIPFEFNSEFIKKVSNSIGDILIRDRQYFVQSATSRKNFDLFLEFLKSDKIQIPEINADNYYDFYKLSKEFNNNILSQHLSKPELKQTCILSMLNAAIRSDEVNKDYCEEFISENLDIYLAFYEDKMSEIPIQTLYNIFNHEKRKLNDQDLAYQFIKKNETKSQDDNNNVNNSFGILYRTIDADKINEQSFNEFFARKDEHNNFLPKMRFTFNDSIKKNFCDFTNQIENKIDQTFNNLTSHMMNEIKSFIELKFNVIQSNYESLSKQTSDAIERIEKLTENQKLIQEEIIKINENAKLNVKQISDEIKNDIKNLSDTISKISPIIETTQTKIVNISGNVENIEKKINEFSNGDTVTKVQNIFTMSDDTQKKVNDISEKVNKINKKCDDACSSLQQLPNKFNDIENTSKQIFEKVGDTLDISIMNNKEFKGIIHDLTKECGGNVSDKGVVNVTGSSIDDDRYLPKDVVDFDDNNSGFISQDVENSWLKYDFINKKVRPTYYIIKVLGKSPNSWVIEGSNSDQSNDWTILDSRENITYDFHEGCDVKSFSIRKDSQFYKYLRFRQTGKNNEFNNHLVLLALEFFGSIQ